MSGSGGKPVPITRENVIWQLRERPAEALSFLIHDHADAIASLVSRILAGVGTPEDVEECVSEVFIQAWHRAQEYDERRGTVRTWLLILAKYQALTLRRRLVQHKDLESESVDQRSDPVLSQVLSRERQESLVSCIQRLEPGVRDVIIYRYFLDMAIPLIATKLQLTRSQVYNRLSRGREQLRQQWDGMNIDGGGTLK
ncbi:MAG: sigma-70 family RNA polymerase sigma factor [Firmicutes bacterium]|nr:sigma-70 family RNA polymerase sigma factor [Bacillota bacterium]